MKYVVFVQDMDETMRVQEIVGPFATYDRANEYCIERRKYDNSRWYGIRELHNTRMMRMSA